MQTFANANAKSDCEQVAGALHKKPRYDGKLPSSEGVKKLFVVQCSMVACHFRMRLRRGIFKKKSREAQPPMTSNN
jgi:hypothetical protein